MLSARAVMASISFGMGADAWSGANAQLDLHILTDSVRSTWNIPSTSDPIDKMLEDLDECRQMQCLGLDEQILNEWSEEFIAEGVLITLMNRKQVIHDMNVLTAGTVFVDLDDVMKNLYTPTWITFENSSPLRTTSVRNVIADSTQ
ncbi:MAG: hypothetical protein P8M22_08700 [Phycisphaerales bacterium]|nr:hypothetical protein [Phycisphaerales bacterium]